MQPDISVVVPMRNEAPNVEQFFRELTGALERVNRPYEIIAVDDGSTDDTFNRLARLQAADPRLRVIRFRRNFGQTAGFAAGFAHARGRYIVTMDGDLQNDPADIGSMVEALEQTPADIVAGWRKDRKDPFLSRRLPSISANWLISRATGVALHDYGCSLKVFRAEVVKPMKLYGEMHRFLPAIASEFGVTIVEQVVNHRARIHGRSKYGISRTIRVVLDLLTVKFLISYSTRPVQIFGLLGIVMGALGGLVLAWLGYVKYFEHEGIGDRPLLLFGILLVLGGAQLLTLGLLAEMQARTYHESQNKPIYTIRDVLESAPVETTERAARSARVGTVGPLVAVLLMVMTLMACGGGGGGSPIAPNTNPPVTVPPPATAVNTPPVIESITASASRAEVGTDVTLTAVVKDAETPIAQLQFEWKADAGTFTGSGPSVTWRAPTGVATPLDYTITLKVTETFTVAGNGNLTLSMQNSATSTGPAIRVHDSPKELGDLAVGFLTAFANSSVSASTCVKDFSDSCKGKRDEKADIDSNREHFQIVGSSLRLRSANASSSGLTGNMTVACSFTSRITKCEPGDTQCVVGAVGTVAGDCTLTAVYEQQRWWLCESHFTGSQVPAAFRSFLPPGRD